MSQRRVVLKRSTKTLTIAQELAETEKEIQELEAKLQKHQTLLRRPVVVVTKAAQERKMMAKTKIAVYVPMVEIANTGTIRANQSIIRVWTRTHQGRKVRGKWYRVVAINHTSQTLVCVRGPSSIRHCHYSYDQVCDIRDGV